MSKLVGKYIDDIFVQESPTGDIDGVNDEFTLSSTPHSAEAVQVFLNGLIQNKSTYSISGVTLTFNTAPPSGFDVYCFYIKR